MDESRRVFAAAMGGMLLSPAWLESAEQELRETGKLSRETVETALQLVGDSMTEEQIEEARGTLERRLKDFEAVRRFAVPPGLEPAIHFKAR
jgi:hypothetical protein